ncbi:MAG: T9SS type A sorting domain-containing protein [Bacteroidetes bacterium]|nr:T9SS type A sorting domain-containing protein [Bacteroidota bacterium]
MRKILLSAGCMLLLLMALLPSQVHAQGNIEWEELWRNVPPPPTNPNHPNAWMTPARSFTGLAYDKWRDVVYIVNPNTTVFGSTFWQTPRIYAWNAANGQPALNMGRSADAINRGFGGELPVPIDTITPTTLNRGYSQNTYSIYKIDMDDEGRIFVGNLVNPIWGICILLPSGQCDPVYLGQGPFRVWRWENPTATPVLAYATLNGSATGVGNINSSEMTYTRWGDAFDVIGKRAWYEPPNNDPPELVDSVRIYVSGGSWPTQPEWNRQVNVILADRREVNQRPNRDVPGGGKLDYRLAIRLINSNSGLAAHGVAATSTQMTQDVWMDSNPRVLTGGLQVQDATDPWPQNFNQTATGNRSLSTSITGASGPIQFFTLPEYGRKFLILADGRPTGGLDPTIPNNNTTARVIDVTTAGSDFTVFNPTPQLGNKTLNNNSGEQNYIADVDFKLQFYTPQEDPDAPGLHIILYVLMSNNGIAAFRSRATFPVELTTLNAVVNGEMIDLTWKVTMETNNHGFEIERSFNGGSSWEHIGFVEGRGTTTEAKVYGYNDAVTETHRNMGNVKYRLRQVDTDGSFTYSPIVDVFFDAVPTAITLYQNYPNPFNPSTTISYQLTQPGHVSLKVFNALGEHVGTLVDESKEAGAHQVQMSAEDLPSGTYIYQVNVDGQIAQKKMTVMK